jgi:hypothetical protein
VPLSVDPLPLVRPSCRSNLLHSHHAALKGPQCNSSVCSVPTKTFA